VTFHRTQGETRDCKGCRYWSEMIARSIDGGPVTALCLSPTSTYRGQYMSAGRICTEWASGHLGAVDEPGQDPDVYKTEAA
jgi:hypothetical protein